MQKSTGSLGKNERVTLRIFRLLVTVVLLIVICGALYIPFVYQTETLWYKFGIDKSMLRAGQMIGLLAAVLLFVQILLAARGKFLKKLFGIAALMRWHRTNGFIISFLVLSHATLILAPEGLTNLPIGKRYWPEMVGMLLLAFILSMAITSKFREILRLNYRRWKTIHRLLGYCAIVLLLIHVLFVSESFGRVVPKAALLTIFTGVAVSVVWSKTAITTQDKRK